MPSNRDVSTAGDGCSAAYAGVVEGAGTEGEHSLHTAADRGVEFGDPEVVEEAGLTQDHAL